MSQNETTTQTRANLGISIKRMTINDPSQLPKDISATPGGTFFSTTPGGTRIIYDRTFLLSRKDSPYAKSPPANLPYIPEVTLIPMPKENHDETKRDRNSNSPTPPAGKKEGAGDMQFEMDI